MRLVGFLERMPPAAVRASPYMERITRTVEKRWGTGRPLTGRELLSAASELVCCSEWYGSAALRVLVLAALEAVGGPALWARASGTTRASRWALCTVCSNLVRDRADVCVCVCVSQVRELCRLQGKALRAFGYDPETQGFPTVS